MFSLYATGVQAYSGLASAWLIYWLGDSTGVLLVTPLVFAAPRFLGIRSRAAIAELAALCALLTAACFVVFGDLSSFSGSPACPGLRRAAVCHVGGNRLRHRRGQSLGVLIATIATLATALGWGPFAGNTSFINAVLLDVFFTALAISGLPLAAAIAERERAKSQREQLIREQAAMEMRLRLAAIVESSNDAIFSKNLDGIVLSWNAAAQRIFGFTDAEVIGKPAAMLLPPGPRRRGGQAAPTIESRRTD